jgi:hypothetical protein
MIEKEFSDILILFHFFAIIIAKGSAFEILK